LDPKHAINDGDVIFSWSGTLKVVRWNRGPAALNQHLFKVVAKDGINPDWLLYVLRAALRRFETMTHGTTMKHITKKALDQVGIEVPAPSEQERIGLILRSAELALEETERVQSALEAVRSSISHALLSGDHQIPESYDRFLEGREDDGLADPVAEETLVS
jgi:type I restriction enzyme S subunit